MHRFFVLPANLKKNLFESKEPDFCHQLTRVLRFKVGAEIVVLDNSGREFKVRLTLVTKRKVCGQVLTQQKNLAESKIRLTLGQALPKKISKFEQILRGGTEVGITKFVPLLTERTEVSSFSNPERARRILRAAAEQSGRGLIPELAEVQKFAEALKCPKKKFLADSFCPQPLLKSFLPEMQQTKEVLIFVGPEGGFTEREVKLAQESGAPNFSLGARVLRVETAGVAIASTILFS